MEDKKDLFYLMIVQPWHSPHTCFTSAAASSRYITTMIQTTWPSATTRNQQELHILQVLRFWDFSSSSRCNIHNNKKSVPSGIFTVLTKAKLVAKGTGVITVRCWAHLSQNQQHYWAVRQVRPPKRDLYFERGNGKGRPFFCRWKHVKVNCRLADDRQWILGE